MARVDVGANVEEVEALALFSPTTFNIGTCQAERAGSGKRLTMA
jgi:hypothetical protein